MSSKEKDNQKNFLRAKYEVTIIEMLGIFILGAAASGFFGLNNVLNMMFMVALSFLVFGFIVKKDD